MNGLLDFIGTPEGQGLLAGAFGGLASARKGTPINNIGKAGVAGLFGYSNAIDQQDQTKERAFNQQFKDVQLNKMRSELERQRAQDAWRGGLPGVLAQSQNPTEVTGGGPPSPFAGPKVLENYLMDPNSPFLDDVLKNKMFPKPGDGFTLGEGQTRYGPSGQLIAQGPAKVPGSDDDAKIKQYKYAQTANGYKGTFAEFLTLGPSIMAGAMAPLRAQQVESMANDDAYKLPPPQVKPSKPSGGGVSVSVGGKSFQFPNQAAANKFKFEAGIK